MTSAIASFDIDFNNFGFCPPSATLLDDGAFLPPTLDLPSASSSGFLDAFLPPAAPTTVWPLHATNDFFPPASAAVRAATPLPPSPLPAPARPSASTSECSFRSITPSHSPSPSPAPLRPRPTIGKRPPAPPAADADARREDRRRRNRESSARCYYNRKRRLVAAGRELADAKRRAVALYARELELRNENARLKKELVMQGGCIPRRMLGETGRR